MTQDRSPHLLEDKKVLTHIIQSTENMEWMPCQIDDIPQDFIFERNVPHLNQDPYFKLSLTEYHKKRSTCFYPFKHTQFYTNTHKNLILIEIYNDLPKTESKTFYIGCAHTKRLSLLCYEIKTTVNTQSKSLQTLFEMCFCQKRRNIEFLKMINNTPYDNTYESFIVYPSIDETEDDKDPKIFITSEEKNNKSYLHFEIYRTLSQHEKIHYIKKILKSPLYYRL